ncbi:MAG: hypothetical protein ACTSPB_16195 [Candidatus Thorarchaeota archaeon]
MKLQLIFEAAPGALIKGNHGIWEERDSDDTITAQQSYKNIIVTALSKIRRMLGPMGLTKNDIQKHQTIEPIGPAVVPFSNLRMAVRKRAERDAEMFLAGGNRERIGGFWGIELPSGYYDIVGQRGAVNPDGQFDDLIRQVVAASENQPVEVRIRLLDQLTAAMGISIEFSQISRNQARTSFKECRSPRHYATRLHPVYL